MSIQESLSKNTPTKWIHIAITLLLMFGFRYLPAVEPITEIGMGVLGVFIGVVYGWITVGMGWTSLFAIVAMGFTGFMTVSEAFAQIGHRNVITLIMIFGILGILESSGITRYIALRILNLRIGRGRPWTMSLLLLIVATILSGITCSWATGMFVWSMFYSICEANSVKKGPFTQYIVTGIMLATITGQQLFPFSVPVLLMSGAYTGVSGLTIPYIPYVAWMVGVSLMINAGYLLVGKYVLRIQAPALEETGLDQAGNLDRFQKIIFTGLIVFLVLLFMPAFLPTQLALTSALNNLSVYGLAALLIGGLLLMDFSQGKKLHDYIAAQANWELIFVMVAVTCISNAIGDESTGVLVFITNVMEPILSGKSILLFLVLITLIPCIVTNFLNNLVVGMMFIPVSFSFAIGFGTNHMAIAVALISICSVALLTPAGCVPAAALHGNTEWISSKQATFYGSIGVLVSYLITLLIGLPIGYLIF